MDGDNSRTTQSTDLIHPLDGEIVYNSVRSEALHQPPILDLGDRVDTYSTPHSYDSCNNGGAD